MFHLLLSAMLCVTPVDLSKRLPITDDYDKAVSIAKVFDKPMIVLFTGSDWDVDSQRFIHRILNEGTFYEVLKKEFVFAHIDFPELETHKAKVIERNTKLKTKFQVESFPMLVLLDAEQNEISRAGLFSEDPEQLAAHLKSLLCRYKEIEKGLALKTIDNERLKYLYTDAKELGASNILSRLLERGLEIDNDPYFQLEHYSNMLTRGLAQTAEATMMRQKILAMDPDNTFGAHYRLAVLDFQSAAEDEKASAETVVEPLLTYINKFGKSDTEHLWRLHMMVSQYLFSKGQMQTALDHARISYQEAPSFMKHEVFQTLEYLKKEVASNS
ncbi:MAG: thioredoxin family protein [Chlamydiales bacterium]|nr:thioredoxin family protein [Chlamydiales bacterium]